MIRLIIVQYQDRCYEYLRKDIIAVAITTDKNAAKRKLAQQVIKEYSTNNSFSEIAKKCNTSTVTVQRILITAGLWTSKRAKQVAELN